MKKLPELTKSEWAIMKACWARGKCTAREIFEAVTEEKGWRYQTVKTMLDRLAGKGYVKVAKIGPICLFEPSVSQTRVLASAMENFVGTVLDGTLAPIFAHLAKGRKLDRAELESLKQLIESHDEEGKQ